MAIVKHYDMGDNSLAAFNNVIFWYISGWELDGGGWSTSVFRWGCGILSTWRPDFANIKIIYKY